MINEIDLSVLVSFEEGYETTNLVLPFRVYQEDYHFKAIPLLTMAERQKAHLPEALYFEFINHAIIPGRGTSNDHIDILKNIIREMQIQESFR